MEYGLIKHFWSLIIVSGYSSPIPTPIILLLLLFTNIMSTGSDMSHIGHPQSKIVRVRPVMILNKMYFIVSWI